ncbi:hypothetical protein TUMEXPCC7403_01085 [Tumidithrix helvetica PCC 7403]|uniref:hypothetical protein n=1 Tax=Tumidithrix helvetica TaxID=3457545 RepID=UPI003C901A5B
MKTLHHSLDCELQMRDREGSSISIRALELAVDFLDGTDSIIRCFLTFIVSPEIYQRIDADELFHLRLDMRGQIFGGKLQPNVDVEIETKIDPSLIYEISTEVRSIEKIADRLLSSSQSQSNDPLLNTESWLALYVKQSVKLPPEFGEGKLKVGYKTGWAD